VETAIVHGLEPKAEGGSVTVSARAVEDGLLLAVEDRGLGLGGGTSGSGIGLQNLKERLAAVYGDAAHCSLEAAAAGGVRAVIRIPCTMPR
jgi:LytS/YehU family sensor histidine kinase